MARGGVRGGGARIKRLDIIHISSEALTPLCFFHLPPPSAINLSN